MATVGNEAIERVKVREVAGIFHSRDALAAAVDALLLAGFDRADIEVMVGGSPARERLGGAFTSPSRSFPRCRQLRGSRFSRATTSSRSWR